MKSFLTLTERENLVAQHKKERDKRICDRIKAVLLYDKGWTPLKISEALLLTENTIRQHVLEYKGSEKLKPKNGGSDEKLSKQQSDELEKHLNCHTYLYTKDIVAYVYSQHDILYTVPGMNFWLKRHGFSYKKPSLVPGKANFEQQREWIETYQKFKKGLPEDETICFMDGVHPTHNTQLSYGWIKKGLRKELPSNTGRARLNLTGVLDIFSNNVIIQENETLNAQATVTLLQEIEKAYPTKSIVNLFCDNAKYYRNKAVSEYLQESKIKLHFLPPYSPNLNPIERLWKWMKERVMYNVYYEHFDDFKSAVLGFLKSLSNFSPGSVLRQSFASRVRDKFRPLGVPMRC